MLVECLHYSTEYPLPHNVQDEQDIFELSNNQAKYYEDLKWVRILPEKVQRKRVGRRRLNMNGYPARDLSLGKNTMYLRKR